jgi:hypothetical protein
MDKAAAKMSGDIQISEAPTTGLGKLILENKFFVPTHQRDYKWDRDRVQNFLDDLTDAMERDDQSYFVGLMVFMREGGKLRVLDGQQRLATTIILLSALQTWFGAADPNGKDAANLQHDFIGRTDYGETQPEPKMTLNINNDDVFQRLVIGGSPLEAIRREMKSAGRRSPNALLLAAIVFIHQRVSEMAEKDGGAQNAKIYFAQLIKFIRESVVAVRLTVPNEPNAFRALKH